MQGTTIIKRTHTRGARIRKHTQDRRPAELTTRETLELITIEKLIKQTYKSRLRLDAV